MCVCPRMRLSVRAPASEPLFALSASAWGCVSLLCTLQQWAASRLPRLTFKRRGRGGEGRVIAGIVSGRAMAVGNRWLDCGRVTLSHRGRARLLEGTLGRPAGHNSRVGARRVCGWVIICAREKIKFSLFTGFIFILPCPRHPQLPRRGISCFLRSAALPLRRAREKPTSFQASASNPFPA